MRICRHLDCCYIGHCGRCYRILLSEPGTMEMNNIAVKGTVTTPDVLLAPDVGHDKDPVSGGPVQHVPAVTHLLHQHSKVIKY